MSKWHLKPDKSKRASPQPRFADPGAVKWMILIGAGYVVTSLIQISALLNYNYYQYLFAQYQESYIHFRYAVSWASRLLGICVGFGILLRKEFFRKAALVLSSGTILVAYWKHPYDGFLRHIDYLNRSKLFMTPNQLIQMMADAGVEGFDISVYASLCVFFAILAECFMGLFVVYVLTRQSVKNAF